MTTTFLSIINKHERDANIEFFENGHKYQINNDPNIKYTSVTTWVHSHFSPFNADKIILNMMSSKNWKEGHKYWNMTAEEIKLAWNSASTQGTELHYHIECFMNQPGCGDGYTHKELLENYNKQLSNLNEVKEWNHFINFIRNTPNLKPFRTEWMIFHEELKIAGSIDMVYENTDGSLSIYDWKRCLEISADNRYNKFAITKTIAHLPDTNFWHYALQLNTYKFIIEQKYGKKVSELFLIRLHPNSNNYEQIIIPILENDIITLFAERKQLFDLSNLIK